MNKTILVFDDDSARGARWAASLRPVVPKAYTVQSLKIQEFKDAIEELEQRRRAARKGEHSRVKWTNVLDSASILIIDYDLLELDKQNYVTGETVAYLARCYSQCGMIIGLNQFGENTFDLTLKAHPDSYADFNLGSEQLANPGLWGRPWTGFRPWAWPVLPKAAEAYENRVKELRNHLKTNIVSFLNFPPEVVATLPRATAEYVTLEDTMANTTFAGFVLESDNGFRRNDKPLNNSMILRVAAARLAKWLERCVLAGQDILVDAPHLVARYPSLITNNRAKIQSWNKIASLTAPEPLGIDHKKIEAFRFSRDNWISRPAWFWPMVANFEQLLEVVEPWSIQHPDWVFCEDLSVFLPKSMVREFVADLPSPFIRRYVADPNSNLPERLATSLKNIDYRPALRFSL